MKSIAIFATHSHSTGLDENARRYVVNLARCFSHVIVVHSCADRNRTQKAWSRDNVTYYDVENHKNGLDFVKYAWGARAAVSDATIDTMLLINDSCYLETEMDAMFQSMLHANCDMAGVTESNEIHYHLQSYCWLLKNRRVINLLLDYFNTFPPSSMKSRKQLIRTFEVGFCQHLLHHQCTLAPVYSLVDVANLSGADTRMCHVSGKYPHILRALGCPLIKKKSVEARLRKSNPVHVPPKKPLTVQHAKGVLRQLHRELTLKHGRFKDEMEEQLMAAMFVQPDDTVLELGGNIGRNSLIIASQLDDSRHLVVMETVEASARKLDENKQMNNLHFTVLNAGLSERPLVQHGWDSKPMNAAEADANWAQVPTITLQQLTQLCQTSLNLPPFTTLVADCEGALYHILQDTPQLLDTLRTIILENDYHDLDQFKFVADLLERSGFEVQYTKAGGWGPCKPMFFQTWTRVVNT